VQKLTELGVDRIVPFRAERSVVRWDEAKAARQHQRLVSIARAACAQAHRCWLPVVEPVTDVADLAGRGAVRLDRGSVGLSLEHPLVAVGPEGGWSAAEREALPSAVGVGAHVLRAETAAITAGALLGAMRSGMVG
jgi:16S rRNA (uracil1498-N3)-methyltransferase